MEYVVHTPTEEDWNKVQEAAINTLGVTWSGTSKMHSFWGVFKEKSCIYVRETLSYCSKKYAETNIQHIPIISTREFLSITEALKTTYDRPITKEKENKVMNQTIAKVFAKDTLEDALLVDNHFGSEISQNFSGELFLTANKQAFLNEAKRRDAELVEKGK